MESGGGVQAGDAHVGIVRGGVGHKGKGPLRASAHLETGHTPTLLAELGVGVMREKRQTQEKDRSKSGSEGGEWPGPSREE